MTYLEQHDLEELRPPTSDDESSCLVRHSCPTPALARFLYVAVGQGWGWSSRLGWTDARWTEHLSCPSTEIWTFHHESELAGYVELNGGVHHDRAATNIKYLGLLPGFCGKGRGAHLLTEAVHRAWTTHLREPSLPTVRRVLVDTSSLDGGAALPNYRARGFREIRTCRVDRAVVPDRLSRPDATQIALAQAEAARRWQHACQNDRLRASSAAPATAASRP